ncbi:MAG: hypothetical protein AB1486_18075 [Planctomycetota bacterium]
MRSIAGQAVDRFEIESGRGFILPDQYRVFMNESRVNLPDGAYLAKVRFDVANSSRPMQNAFPFYVKDGQPVPEEASGELLLELQRQSAGFTVSPAELFVELQPGGRRAQTVELTNLTRETIRVRPSLLEWSRGPGGRDVALSGDPGHGRSARGYVEIRNPEVDLLPLARSRVPIMVALPRSAEGEWYCALSFDRDDVQLNASPEARARRGAMLSIHAAGTGTKVAEISGLKAMRKPNGAQVFTVEFRNTGDLGFAPDVTFYLRDDRGDAVAKTTPPSAPAMVQAGAAGRVSTELATAVEPGTYRLEVALKFDPRKPPLVQQVEVEIAPVLRPVEAAGAGDAAQVDSSRTTGEGGQ